MCFSFETTARQYPKKGIFTGSPIRQQILKGDKNRLKLDFDQKPTVLFVGGSLGATAINNALDKTRSDLLTKYNIIHIAGKNYTSTTKEKGYLCVPYANNIEDYLDASDIVVSRSGSNAIYEFLQLQKPMLLIPLPKTSSRGDQILNANDFKSKGYADVLLQENLTKNTLMDHIDELYKNRSKYVEKMKKATLNIGNEKIVEVILENENK